MIIFESLLNQVLFFQVVGEVGNIGLSLKLNYNEQI
jgi:hypothetical protein